MQQSVTIGFNKNVGPILVCENGTYLRSQILMYILLSISIPNIKHWVKCSILSRIASGYVLQVEQVWMALLFQCLIFLFSSSGMEQMKEVKTVHCAQNNV